MDRSDSVFASRICSAMYSSQASQQALLGPEVVDHQCGADARGACDGPQPDAEAVLAHLVDRGVADPGDGREIVR